MHHPKYLLKITLEKKKIYIYHLKNSNSLKEDLNKEN